jgi:eukaryotic-like serine/threonine-protein kinase
LDSAVDANQQQEESIFAAARELTDPAQRRALLDRACAGDPALRHRLEKMLAALADADHFFLEGEMAVHSAVRTSETPAEQPGERIGRYKLLEKIGEGGCGVVYMAEQQEPVRRRVALKVIKVGMDTRNVIARFEAERQALAMMDHPNIAKVLDAGATETGRPFFVMELVRGIRITQYCEENELPIHDRLELFLQVCQAVQHAHQKGVIHRDLKPSNILVTINDGVAVPKVIDFGIAKATAEPLTEKTLFTAFAQLLGTPAYMSPEQATMTSVDIDTRSDIYSLGVLLYELLTAQTPFDTQQLLRMGWEELRRTICEREPMRPSTRLTQAPVSSDARRLSPKSQIANRRSQIDMVRGDLDWIVMKCLEKDRARRYETANSLAMDIQRLLNDEPIVARPPSNLYRFQKLVRRHRLAFVAAAVVLAVLVLGILASTLEATRARRAEETQSRMREQAQQAQGRAEAQAYASDMNLVQQAWDEGDMELAQTLLRSHVPKPGEADLRGFEWRYLWKLCQDESQYAFTNFTDEVSSVVFSPDGRVLAAGGGHSVKLLDITTRREIDELSEPDGWIGRMAFSPASTNVLATAGGGDNVIRLWDLATKRVIARLTGPRNWINSIAFSPDGSMLASAGQRNLILWNVEKQTPIWRRETPANVYVSINAAAFTPDGKALVSGGGQRPKMKVWEVASGNELQRFPPDHTGGFLSATFAPSGQVLATIGGDNRLLLWDFAERRLRFELPSNFNSPAVAFSPDGRLVASGAGPNAIRVWDVASGRSILLLHGHRAGITALAFTPDGTALISGSKDHTVRVWDLKPRGDENILREHHDWVASGAFSPDGNWLASAEMFHPVRTLVWDVPSRRLITNLTGHADAVVRALFSPNGHILATGSFDHTVMLWTVPTLRLIGVLTNDFEATSLAFSPEGRVLAVGGLMGAGDERPEFKVTKRLTFWDVHSQKKLNLVPDAAVGAAGVAFSDEGRLFATGHFDGSVRIWDFHEGRLLAEFPQEHRNLVWSVAFSRDCTRLASSGEDGKVVVYDVAGRRVLSRLKAHGGFAWSVAFAPDNRTLASSGDDGIKLWNLATLRPALTLRRHTGSVAWVTFTRDGNLMASGGADATVRLWPAASVSEIP